MQFNVNEPILQEISFLDLKYLKHFLSREPKEVISLKTLCNVTYVLDESQAIEVLCSFANYYWNSCTTKLDNLCTSQSKKRTTKSFDNECTNNLPLLIESESDLDSDQEEQIDIQDILKQKCYCMHCVLKELKALNSKTHSYESISNIYI